MESFYQVLANKKLQLTKGVVKTLQINICLFCNQTCNHCHLECSPNTKEFMTRETMDHVINYIKKNDFDLIDITGGAPELHPDILYFLEQIAQISKKIIIRSNLSALLTKNDAFVQFLADNKINIVASFPSLNKSQVDSLRGKNIFDLSIKSLKRLNKFGYGTNHLELDLVVNPTGALFAPNQESLEKRFKKSLRDKWDIKFNQLFCFNNAPLGRFKKWLEKTDNYNNYLEKLATSFNPDVIDNVMCKNLITVSYEGYLYDCDFNYAAQLYMNNKRVHISELNGLPEIGATIPVANHCYTCTAGSGFT